VGKGNIFLAKKNLTLGQKTKGPVPEKISKKNWPDKGRGPNAHVTRNQFRAKRKKNLKGRKKREERVTRV